MIKIKKVEGCTAFFTEINGKDLDDLSKEEKENLIENLLHDLIQGRGLDGAIHALLEHIEYDSYESGEPCDQCGDTVQTSCYTLNEPL